MIKQVQYNQNPSDQATFKQVNRLKWILAEYFLAEKKIERTTQNKKLFEIRLYASMKNLHNVAEKQRPTVGIVQLYFDKYGMAKNADGVWERTSKTKLPKELVALVQIDEPETTKKTAKKTTKKTNTVSARKKTTEDKKSVKITGKNMTDDQKADMLAELIEQQERIQETINSIAGTMDLALVDIE